MIFLLNTHIRGTPTCPIVQAREIAEKSAKSKTVTKCSDNRLIGIANKDTFLYTWPILHFPIIHFLGGLALPMVQRVEVRSAKQRDYQMIISLLHPVNRRTGVCPPLSVCSPTPPKVFILSTLGFYGIEIARKTASYRKRPTTNCFIQIRLEADWPRPKAGTELNWGERPTHTHHAKKREQSLASLSQPHQLPPC